MVVPYFHPPTPIEKKNAEHYRTIKRTTIKDRRVFCSCNIAGICEECRWGGLQGDKCTFTHLTVHPVTPERGQQGEEGAQQQIRECHVSENLCPRRASERKDPSRKMLRTITFGPGMWCACSIVCFKCLINAWGKKSLKYVLTV